MTSFETFSLLTFAVCLYFSHKPARSVEDDGSDDNRSSSLGRSAPSDDASDYQDEASECKFTIIPILVPAV